jgi:predicted nucleic acid-binding protein
MNYFALDASALVKRYHNEPGAEVVQALTDALLAGTSCRVLESAVLLRRNSDRPTG